MPSERSTFPFLVGRPASTFYRPCDVLGRGAFGKVRRCHKMATDEPVAVKVLKRSAIKRAMKEVSMLRKLSHLDLDRCNIVKFHEGFRLPRGRPCLVFELLDISLWDYMKARKPLHVRDIRPVVQQVAVALQALKAVGMIHMDLKPDNIMLVNQDQHPFRVKLIDFGAAMNPADAVLGVQQQNIVCRAPEVFLGLPFSEAIDAWSLGCVMARLRLGYWLYPGKGEFDVVTATDVVKSIVHINGRPADHLLSRGVNTARFFKRAPAPANDWILKTPEEDEKQESIKLRGLPSAIALSCLDDLKVLATTRGAGGVAMDPEESGDVLQWVELLQSMLQTDPQRRTTPDKILAHPFICMSHMARSYGHSAYVQSCVDCMTTAVPDFLKPPFKDSQRAKVPLTTTQLATAKVPLTSTQLAAAKVTTTNTQLATAKVTTTTTNTQLVTAKVTAKVTTTNTQLVTAKVTTTTQLATGSGGVPADRMDTTSQQVDDRCQAPPQGGDT